MANMTYCMFENTLNDLQQVYNAIVNGDVDESELSNTEKRAKGALLDLCIAMVEEAGYNIEKPEEESEDEEDDPEFRNDILENDLKEMFG